MKRRMTFSITLTLSLLLSLVSLPATAQGQQARRFRADTGVVTPGMGQILRVTVAAGAEPNDFLRVRFAWMKYIVVDCEHSLVCRHVVQSRGTTTPVLLDSNNSASFDIQGTGAGVRVMVQVDNANVNADAQIINVATGEVTSHVIMANTEGDFH